jgi:hypothetical protein
VTTLVFELFIDGFRYVKGCNVAHNAENFLKRWSCLSEVWSVKFNCPVAADCFYSKRVLVMELRHEAIQQDASLLLSCRHFGFKCQSCQMGLGSLVVYQSNSESR